MTRRHKQKRVVETRRLKQEFFEHVEADIPIWKEALFGAELLLLHASPVYYGFGVPHGDGSAVIVIPGFLCTDFIVRHLSNWLGRVGYTPYVSGIGVNAECPNLLIKQKLRQTMDRALDETGRKVHLIGHSLGGVIARSVACSNSKQVASVISIASPFRGTVVHKSILNAARLVRERIIREHGESVLPDCYTPSCTCNFVEGLRCNVPACVLETAIYTQDDGIVDWRYCTTGDCDCDFEVSGTHIGLVFNATVYSIIANRLALAR